MRLVMRLVIMLTYIAVGGTVDAVNGSLFRHLGQQRQALCEIGGAALYAAGACDRETRNLAKKPSKWEDSHKT
jgi:hypothetical protein